MNHLSSTLVLCDLDHLLLGADGNLTQVVRDVLQLFVRRGGRFTVFSQRTPRAVRSILGSVRLSAPALVCGGAMAYHFSDGTRQPLCSFAGQDADLFARLPVAEGVGIALQISSMISRMPAGQVAITSAENGKTTIQSGVVQFEIQSMPANDFPELPNTGAEETLTIKTGVLKDMIDRTLYAVSQDEKKPAHTGELFEILPDKLTVVALDGYRLAIVERPVTAVKDIRIIVPSKTMTEVAHLLPNDDEEPVHISANRRYVVFMAGGYTIMSRLIEGEFLNYRNVIPADSRTRVTIDTKEFIETIERASLIITERLKNPLRISFTEGRVVVRCQTNLGRVVDEFNADCEGDEVEIGFNNRYLLDALRNARTEKVRMEISGPLSPVKVLPAEGNDFLYLVLPVRFKND